MLDIRLGYKRLYAVLALFVLLAFPVSASMVSFLLVETGIGEEAPRSQYASPWEGGLMDAFFNAGHIVTNSPITRLATKPVQDLSGPVGDDFNDAAMNGADYYVVGFMEYQVQGARPVLVGISLKLYNTLSGKLVFEQGFPVGTGANLADEYRIAQNAGRIIISHLEEL
jgi:hypothetical protein